MAWCDWNILFVVLWYSGHVIKMITKKHARTIVLDIAVSLCNACTCTCIYISKDNCDKPLENQVYWVFPTNSDSCIFMLKINENTKYMNESPF